MTEQQSDDLPLPRAGIAGREADLLVARQLSELARDFEQQPDPAAVLHRIVTSAVAEVPGAAHAGVALVHHGNLSTEAKTSDLVAEIDEIQYRVGVGPCLSTVKEQQTVRANNLRAETRWPAFAAAAADRGVLSMLSLRLFVDGDNLGALNLYAETPDAFSDDSEAMGALLAAHAAVALRGAQLEQNLRTALATRDLIGQAKGILMERYKLSPTQAFDLLIAASQTSHVKLRDVADRLAATGELAGLGR